MVDKGTGLMTSLQDVNSSQEMLFANHSSYNACIMILLGLTFFGDNAGHGF